MFPRSANKPIQALGMLRAGLPLDGKLLAIASASHSGEPFHLDAVREILALAGLDESALQTPAVLSAGSEGARGLHPWRWSSAPICMDCSGKHAAMLLTCVTNGWPTETYLAAEHPLQVVITETFTELTQGPPSVIGVDGCGAPLLATPLVQLARAVGRIAAGAPGTPEATLASAMKAHPGVRQWHQPCRARSRTGVPTLVAKSGAESVYVVAQPDGEAFALKIEDGAERPLYAVMARALELAGLSAPVLASGRRCSAAGTPSARSVPTF